MTLRQEKDRSGDITFDSDYTWEAYGSNKSKFKDGQKKKDRESYRLGSTKKESRQPHRLGSTNDGFGEASNSSFALDDEVGFSHDWKSFTEDSGWSEMDRQQAKAWKTAQSEHNVTRGEGRRGSVSRGNSSSSSLDLDFQEEPQPSLKVNPSIGARRERSGSMRMVPKQARGISPLSTSRRGISPSAPQRGVRRNKSNNLQNLQLHGANEPTRVRTRRRTSMAAGLSLENNAAGLDRSGRRAPPRAKSMDVDMFGTSDLGFGVDATWQSSDNNLINDQSFRLAAPNEPPGRSRRRASLALNAQHKNPNDTPSEPLRVRSRRRASVAAGVPSPNVQDLQLDQTDIPNETPRTRSRRRASVAANDGNMDGRRGVQRTKSMDVDMRGPGDSRPGLGSRATSSRTLGSTLGFGDSRPGLGSRQGSSRTLGSTRTFRNVRRINSTDSQETSFRNANRHGNESASGSTDEADIPLPLERSRSPRRSPRRNDSNMDLHESADRKNRLSPRSRRRLNMQRINSVDSSCSSNDGEIQKALANDHKNSENSTASRRAEHGHRRRGVHRVNSSGLQDLISGLHSKKKADLEAELNAEENQTSESDKAAPERLQTHLEDQESMTAQSADSVPNDSSTVPNSSHTNDDMGKMKSPASSARLHQHAGTSQSGKKETSSDTGSNRFDGHFGNSGSTSLKSGESESNKSEQSRSTSNQLDERVASGSTSERERTPNSSRALRKRRETPKRGVNRSKSSDDSMTFGAWTSGDSSVRSGKKSQSRRKSVSAGECQRSAPHLNQSDTELLNNGGNTLPPHDKGFITSFLGSA